MSEIFRSHRAIDKYGVVQSGAIVRFYEAGTNFGVSLNVFDDDPLTIDAGTFITADDAGKFRPVYLGPHIYAMRMETASGNIMEYDIDPYNGVDGTGGDADAQDGDRYVLYDAVGVLSADELIGTAVASRRFKLIADNGRNKGYCSVAPTIDFDVLLKLEGSTVITCAFTIGNTAAVCTGSGEIVVQPGQVLTLHAPNPADLTAANFAFSFFIIDA